MSSSKDIKVVLLGDSGVGKSSILHRFVANEFKPNMESTSGAAFLSQILTHNEVQYKFQIWDTAGQEKYKSLVPLYYKDSRAAVVVFDITKRNSFEVLKEWITELRVQGPSNIIIYIVGNKLDLIEEEQIKMDEAQQYAREIGASFIYTSAKDNKGIVDLFKGIAEEIEHNDKNQTDKKKEKPGQQLKQKQAGGDDKKKKCC